MGATIGQITDLTRELISASEAYYNTGATIMSDAEFDKKLEQLRQMEDEIGFSFSNSPTHNVGAKITHKLPEVTHEYPMLSLNKCHTVDEIRSFAGDKEIIAMTKLDGLTVCATYIDGKLVGLETRGNGIIGNDVMIHAASFANLPARINKKGKYVVHGECVIPIWKFKEINETILNDEDKYKNPRNLAAGTLNSLDANVSAERGLTFICWDIVEGGCRNVLSDNLLEAFSLGFGIVELHTIKFSAIQSDDSILEYMNMFKTISATQDIPMDGVVLKFNDITYGKFLGRTDKFFKNGIAYKFMDDRYPTRLVDVEWTMGKTGVLTPTIVTEPVEIDGTTVTRASVHNVSIFKSLHLTKGCTCMMYKANMIIPQCDYTENNDGEPYEVPSICPECGTPTTIVCKNESEILACTNQHCKGRIFGMLEHFVSRDAMDIDGLSIETLKFLDGKGWIDKYGTPVDAFISLYDLKSEREEWWRCVGWSPRSVNKILKAIEDSKNTTLDRFIYALGIPLIGKTAAKVISKKYKGHYIGMKNEIKLGVTNWDKLSGFGQNMANSLDEYFMYNFANVDALAELMNFQTEEQKEKPVGKDLTGKTFVITGSLHGYSNRDELKDKLENLGAKVSGSVSKNTFALICNEDAGSSKSKKAKELGVDVWTEDDLEDYLLEV